MTEESSPPVLYIYITWQYRYLILFNINQLAHCPLRSRFSLVYSSMKQLTPGILVLNLIPYPGSWVVEKFWWGKHNYDNYDINHSWHISSCEFNAAKYEIELHVHSPGHVILQGSVTDKYLVDLTHNRYNKQIPSPNDFTHLCKMLHL
jgi:hypothetical protein